MIKFTTVLYLHCLLLSKLENYSLGLFPFGRHWAWRIVLFCFIHQFLEQLDCSDTLPASDPSGSLLFLLLWWEESILRLLSSCGSDVQQICIGLSPGPFSETGCFLPVSVILGLCWSWEVSPCDVIAILFDVIGIKIVRVYCNIHCNPDSDYSFSSDNYQCSEGWGRQFDWFNIGVSG